MLFQYIILGFVFAAGIGPVNIETAKRGLTDKTTSASLFYLGNVIIDAFYILVIMFGFSLFVDSTTIKVVLGIFGITYLLYLGISDILDFFKKDVLSKKTDLKHKKLNPLLEGILVNLANPMAIASWLAFYSVIPSGFSDSIFNFLAVILGAILVGVVIVLITHIFKKVVGEKIMRVISLIAGIILIGFSLLFAYNLFYL